MEKLNMAFQPAQILKAELMNMITGKVDEIVDEVNTLPAKVTTNKLEIDALKAKEVDLPQEDFDKMKEAGTLDTSKEYYTYED